jgi:hypothetical protein
MSSSLDSRVAACEANFTKMKDFIRDNIGPDLSHIKTLVRAEVRTTTLLLLLVLLARVAHRNSLQCDVILNDSWLNKKLN